MISKIKIKEYGILKDTELYCKKYNLIFGYNGSGKTTLTNIFKDIENNNIQTDKYEIESEKDLYIKVYSGKDYLNENFEKKSPISFNLGKENIELKNNLDKLNEKIIKLEESIKFIENEIEKEEKSKVGIYRNIAQNVTSALKIKSQSFDYRASESIYLNNNDFEKLDENYLYELSNEYINVKSIKEIKPIENIHIDKILNLYNNINDYINKKVIKTSEANNIFKEFVKEFEKIENNEYKKWIRDGLTMSPFNNKKCPFCFRPLDDLYKSFINYFNNEVNNIISTLTGYNKEIDDLKNQLDKIYNNIDENLFYKSEKQSIINLKENIFSEVNNALLIDVKNVINKKINDIYSNDNLYINNFVENIKNINSYIDKININMEEHNNSVLDISKKQEENLNLIAYHYIALNKDNIDSLIKSIDINKNKISTLKKEKELLYNDKIEIEKQIDNIEIPVEELNKNLHEFLFREDINIKYNKDSKEYEITRGNDNIKSYISEGEKTAIGIVHFIISLKDNKNNRNKEDCIVIIDDPVSSLDSYSLYNSYSFLHSNLDNVKQLFIITHHFYFFKRIYQWFYHNKDIKKRNKDNINYSIKEIERVNGKFLSVIKDINPYFEKFESEYQYLYNELQILRDKLNNNDNINYEEIIKLPNMCRRIFESAISFIDPFNSHDNRVNNLIEKYGIDEEKRKYLLYIYRYTNTESHYRAFDLYYIYQKNPNEAKGLINSMFYLLDNLLPFQVESYNNYVNKN